MDGFKRTNYLNSERLRRTIGPSKPTFVASSASTPPPAPVAIQPARPVNVTKPPKTPKRFSLSQVFVLRSLVVLLVIAILGVFFWQHSLVSNLNKQVSQMQTAELPIKTFANYNNCVDYGGDNLSTINGQFNACLEGNKQVILQYSSQNLPQITSNSTTTLQNDVTVNEEKNNFTPTSDLISYLTNNQEGCYQGSTSSSGLVKGYYRVIKETADFALLNYGCINDTHATSNKYFMIAVKLASGWVEISPTNNFNSQGVPSCLMMDMYKISSQISSTCFQDTGYNNNSIRTVNYP